MKSIIEEIFFGNNSNSENIEIGEEYSKLNKKSGELYDEFVKNLTNMQKAQFNEICNLDMATEAEAVQAYYIAGFKLGFLIAVECLKD